MELIKNLIIRFSGNSVDENIEQLRFNNSSILFNKFDYVSKGDVDVYSF
ncbi:MAG: hypothetical protein HUJ56_05155 [Erysipelotrichaceae bacterium]|nr:hypothetical protein [Erysipelotrichaceae bacterium]